jgi:aryl-alcohol dehydrogenase-like predicted oxidoreductase
MTEIPYETPFEQIRLGDSDMVVSSVGFGTYHLRDKIGGAEAIDAMGAAFEAGITLYDTSDNYGTEELIGLAVREGVLPRDKIVIATKTGLATSAGEAYEFAVRDRQVDLSPVRVEAQVEKSLRLLGDDVGVIDLYQLHRHDPSVPPQTIARTMDRLIAQDKIRAYGVSNYPPEAIEDLLQACDQEGTVYPVSSQPFANLVGGYDSLPTEAGANGGLTTIAHSPLHKGLLSGEMVGALGNYVAEVGDPEMRVDMSLAVGYLAELHAAAARSGHTLAQLAVAWVLNHPDTVVLSSPTSEERLQDMRQAAQWQPESEILEIIEEAQEHFEEIQFADRTVFFMMQQKLYYRS